MGLSASQAKMLSLTARLSDLELRAQTISNAKIRLSDESAGASQKYSDALNKQNLKVYSGLQSNGTSSYVGATAANLTTYGAISSTDKQRFIKTSAGAVLVSKNISDCYKKATIYDDSWYMTNQPGYLTSVPLTYDTYKNMSLSQLLTDGRFYNFVFDVEGRPDLDGNGSRDYPDFPILCQQIGSGKLEYYQTLFLDMLKDGYQEIPDDKMNSSEWLQSQIDGGNIYLYEYDSTAGTAGTGDYTNVSWTSGDATLSEVTDTTDTAKAEAEYETTMASIQSKDKRFDMQLSDIDTEHTATQTEIESVKKVMNKNIERSFKIFDA